MNPIEAQKQVKADSRRFAKMLILEIGFCAVLYFVFTHFLVFELLLIYLFLLFSVPLAYNVYSFQSARKNNNPMGKHYAIIAQVLVLLFTLKFLF